ncbi:STAS domain-containing protein [Solemya velesiana gill symbiont]|uniref:Anti-anti-sigma factor n=1 Tax=Solemya velesiana gill symbiont TaxID=1918948 RepID=A0A1T2KMG7_9GAMM|nr:STAS domain-containing protein [Solemya velesiana gill symbiont]OOZ34063.1 anti-anti-sigma factor [Solemya velesiana gill symbiont]
MPVSATESSDSSDVTIHVSGRFDFSCHQDFLEAYTAFPKGEKRYVVDLGETEYMDSSAMGMLLQLREYGDKESSVVLVNANEGVREVLRIANFDKLFRID